MTLLPNHDDRLSDGHNNNNDVRLTTNNTTTTTTTGSNYDCSITTNSIITKDMYHVELQSYHTIGRIVIWTMTRDWFVSWIYNKLFAWLLRGLQLPPTSTTSSLDNCPISLVSETRWITLPVSQRKLRVRIFYRQRQSPTTSTTTPADIAPAVPGILYIHGGATISQCPEIAMEYYHGLLQRRDCIIVSPDYRLAINHPYPAGFNDCYETALWMMKNRRSRTTTGETNNNNVGGGLNIQSKLIVCGHSSGGGMCAGITLKARDTQDFDVAFQMPCYPMIDYRPYIDVDGNDDGSCSGDTTTKSDAVGIIPKNITTGYIFCDISLCRYAWNHYLKGIMKKSSPVMKDNGNGIHSSNDDNDKLNQKQNDGIVVPIYASPILNTNYHGIPPTISYVGDLEPFYQDTVRWIQSLQQHNVAGVKFKIFQGAFHGFDDIASSTTIGKAGMKFFLDSFEEYYDRYCDDNEDVPIEEDKDDPQLTVGRESKNKKDD